MPYHAGPMALVLFAECFISTDSDVQIQNYKNEVQLKLKLHQLYYGELNCDSVNSSLVFF